MERRLAAILAADVVGYSRLIRADEEGTLAAFQALRSELVDPKIAAHRGRIVKAMGDGILVEFASVVDAVRAAGELQQAIAERNTGLPQAKRIVFRIGVNLGDVVIEGDDIHGDGVNVAARLEALAEPGGICVSGGVYEQIRDRIDLPFDDLGEQQVKNIDRPVRAWSWVAATKAVPQEPREHTTPVARPSIAVLPFANLSGDPEQEYFADGIAEDIITALSRIRQFFVIARNTTFTYKGKAVDVQAVARELGVRYVLEGSVRKSADRVRITAQLIDGVSGSHVWAERYDRELSDIFAVQDEITQTVVGTIEPELGRAEQDRARRKPPGSLDAWDLYQQGLWHIWRLTREENTEARRLFRRAIEVDPDFCAAYAYLVFALFEVVILGYAEDRGAAIDEMFSLARTALAIDDHDALAHWAMAGAYAVRNDSRSAIDSLQRAIELNPSFARAHERLADAYNLSGQPEAAIRCIETAIRLSPNDPHMWATMMVRALAALRLGNLEAAEHWARRSTRQAARAPMTYVVLLACLGHLDRISEAKEVRDELVEAFPDYDIAEYFQHSRYARSDFFEALLRDGLRKIGWES